MIAHEADEWTDSWGWGDVLDYIIQLHRNSMSRTFLITEEGNIVPVKSARVYELTDKQLEEVVSYAPHKRQAVARNIVTEAEKEVWQPRQTS